MIDLTPAQCPNCQSTNTAFDKDFGYHECNDCHNHWALDKDDPDYREYIIDAVLTCPVCNTAYYDELPEGFMFRVCGECGHEF